MFLTGQLLSNPSAKPVLTKNQLVKKKHGDNAMSFKFVYDIFDDQVNSYVFEFRFSKELSFHYSVFLVVI